ncbi:19826_t:CDS:2, partial [Cetraspora pellucida]
YIVVVQSSVVANQRIVKKSLIYDDIFVTTIHFMLEIDSRQSEDGEWVQTIEHEERHSVMNPQHHLHHYSPIQRELPLGSITGIRRQNRHCPLLNSVHISTQPPLSFTNLHLLVNPLRLLIQSIAFSIDGFR